MENLINMDTISEVESLIYSIIYKYQKYFELEDLYQVAVIGLIKAKKNYKEGYNAKFTSYAYQYILGEVITYINNNCSSIKISPKTKKLYLKIQKAREILSQKLMKNVSNYELSVFLDIDEKIINETIIACSTVDSLDRIVNDDNKNKKLYDILGYSDSSIDNYELKIELEKLKEEEKKIIMARFYENKSQREVAKELGKYQVEISRKEQKILKKIHDNMST